MILSSTTVNGALSNDSNNNITMSVGNTVIANVNSSGIYFESGKKAIYTGAVLQVVNTNYFTQVSTSGSSFVTTGLSATITPSSTSSKILIFTSGGDVASTTAGTGVAHALYRGAGTTLLVQYSNQGPVYIGVNGNYYIGTGPSTNYLDSPSTTSAVSYYVYFKPQSAGPTATVQRDSTSSTMTLMEIAG